MSRNQKTLDELESAILALATRAAGQGERSDHVVNFARAAELIDEARAWYISPGQSHGGSGQVELKG